MLTPIARAPQKATRRTGAERRDAAGARAEVAECQQRRGRRHRDDAFLGRHERGSEREGGAAEGRGRREGGLNRGRRGNLGDAEPVARMRREHLASRLAGYGLGETPAEATGAVDARGPGKLRLRLGSKLAPLAREVRCFGVCLSLDRKEIAD